MDEDNDDEYAINDRWLIQATVDSVLWDKLAEHYLKLPPPTADIGDLFRPFKPGWPTTPKGRFSETLSRYRRMRTVELTRGHGASLKAIAAQAKDLRGSLSKLISLQHDPHESMLMRAVDIAVADQIETQILTEVGSVDPERPLHYLLSAGKALNALASILESLEVSSTSIIEYQGIAPSNTPPRKARKWLLRRLAAIWHLAKGDPIEITSPQGKRSINGTYLDFLVDVERHLLESGHGMGTRDVLRKAHRDAFPNGCGRGN